MDLQMFSLSRLSSPGTIDAKMWSDEETIALIDLWGSEDIQQKLATKKRNRLVWEEVSNQMAIRGFRRSAKQCVAKIHNLKVEFRKVKTMKKDNNFKFFDIMDPLMANDVVLAAGSSEANAVRQASGVITAIDAAIQKSPDLSNGSQMQRIDSIDTTHGSPEPQRQFRTEENDAIFRLIKVEVDDPIDDQGDTGNGTNTRVITAGSSDSSFDVPAADQASTSGSSGSISNSKKRRRCCSSIDLEIVFDKLRQIQEESDKRFYEWEERRLRLEQEFEERRQQLEAERESRREQFLLQVISMLSKQNSITNPMPAGIVRTSQPTALATPRIHTVTSGSVLVAKRSRNGAALTPTANRKTNGTLQGFDALINQKELDETAAELANRQDESENSRKKLVDQSRDFKKNTPEDVRKQVTPLLKSFQAEIDSLSKRSKAAEASFLTLYKKIIEAPDPVPTMEQMAQSQKKAQRCNELELENKNLRLTLDQYNAEFAEVRNQEVTIRQLKERIKVLEEQTDSIVEARVAEQETASKRFYEERERQLQEENESLSQKLKEAEERAKAVQTSLNAAQSELFVLRSRGDELGSAKASELELILSDVERANQRADTAEKECELLKEKIRNLEESGRTIGDDSEAGDDGQEKRSKAQSYELELASKDKQIGQLLEELKQVNGKLIEAEKRHQSERIELTQQLETAEERYQEAEIALKAQSDYDEIKRELNILKTIELGGNEEDYDEDSPSYDGIKKSSSEAVGKTGPQKSLEMLLLEKNKALQDENASLRNSNRGLNVQQASFCREISDEQLDALIAGVSDQQADQSNGNQSPPDSGAFEGLEANALSDYRKKKDPSKPGAGAPLQNIVKRMACLVGTELVAMYQASEEQANGASNNIPVVEKPSKPIKPVGESRRKSSMPSQVIQTTVVPAPPSPSNSAMSAMAMDLLASLRSPTPAGFEEALASGVPREIVEYVALYHLQQSVAKKVRESAAAGEILDTANVAQRCRAALSSHNIGQRLLAKCILNQSQGSVSELLSKPKPWEKLTEKGKESFRRIQAWLSDESSIELLRMISPKRAYGGFRERYPLKQEDSSTQDKINAILNEAASTKPDVSSMFGSSSNMGDSAPSQVMVRNSAEYSPESRQTSTPNSTTASGSCPSPSKNIPPGGNRSSGRYRHDDIPKEMVYEIYRRELEKLQAQESVGGTTPADTKPTKLQVSIPSAGGKSFSDIRPAQKRPQPTFSTPQSLLMRVASGSTARPRPRRAEPKRLSGLGLSFIQRRTNQQLASNVVKNNQLSAMRQRSVFANNRRAENRAGMRLPPVRPSWSASRPKFATPGAIRTDDPVSPTATTALNATTPTNTEDAPQSFSPGGTPIVGTKAFKAILPPISQEQFEEYNNIDTEDLVRKVKDYLTKFSISQRLFGEQVLGLSQGSVSDLLARPKLWSMLTQKGREPFIRMQLFLSDKKALQKLMEKRQQQLQSQGGEGAEGMDSVSGDEMSMSGIGSSSFALPVQTSPAPAPTIPVSAPPSGSRSRRKPAVPRVSMAAREANRPRELSGIAALLQVAMRGGGAGNNEARNKAPTMPTVSMKSSGGGHTRRYIPASAIPEPAEPIDTKDIVTQVKALLLSHNIGQKVFGATVLDMSQGAVSDLLSKTKPWELLSARGREAILRMKAWLEDPNRLEKVFQGRTPPPPKAPSLKRPATEALLPSTAAFFGGEEALSPANEAKKARVVLTDEQKHILRSAYDEDSYPSSETVNTLARQLGLSVRTVVNWFHNRRMRSKPPPGTAPAGQGDEAEEAVSDDGIDASAFGGDVPDQYYSYEDELAFAHAELERLATEEDGVGMEQHSEDLGSSLNADDSGWGAGGAAMDNMGWTGDDEEPIEEDTGNPYHESNKVLQEENASMQKTVAQQKELIAKLEDDLSSVNALQRPEAIGAESPDDVTRDFLTKAVSPATGPVIDSSAADSLLPIVAGQRERFRQRVQELEEQNLQYQQHMALLQTEIERSRADNVKLYEKIKFLQSYRGSGGQTAVSMDDQTLEKYSSEYEQSLDPFRRFGVQERQRKYQALRTHDKATLRISRIIMSSGTARAFFFFYLLFLHCLVFLVLYKTAYTESCKRDFNTECVQKFREHMHQVHGQGHGHGHTG